jgi:hypothetical protein
VSVRILCSCDSQDYETPASHDAELWWAELLAKQGVPANVCLVTEEARALARRGRGDVLAAWARHEVASHTNLHSAHPTPAEYLDDLAALDRDGAFGAAAGQGAALARLGPWEGGERLLELDRAQCWTAKPATAWSR